ncbi:MAG: sigma-54-dependent Fis family transcriptional regulator [Kangiella sp.]|nr:MAG: sigma-54-dependent Fis family transcriptional regulator [Kangiella sp.]
MNNGLSTVLLCGFPHEEGQMLSDYLGMHYSIRICNENNYDAKLTESASIDLILAYHKMPEFNAISFLIEARQNNPQAVRVLAGDLSKNEMHEAINKAAIYQFLPQNWPVEQIELHVRRALENRELGYRHRHLSRDLKMAENVLKKYDTNISTTSKTRYKFNQLVYASPSMITLCDMARKAALTELPILIQGETGTGKELMARAVHNASERNAQPLMVHNCGGMSDELLHSELFGHVKGAYTGAVSDRLGLLPAANGGTVFLDEIADVSPTFQVSLLRFLQDGEVKPLGSDKIIKCDVRVIAAGNRNLEELIKKGEFREDLFYRLNGFQLKIPPLRSRIDDIRVLTEYLSERYAQSINRRILGISKEVLEKFELYDWPGNVRELENEIKRLVAVSENGQLVNLEHLSENIKSLKPLPNIALTKLNGDSLKETVEKLELSIISATLQKLRWNQSKVAKELGISRMGLSNKIKRYGIESVILEN